MEPIVSPWLIYGIEMLKPLNFFGAFICCLMVVPMGAWIMASIEDGKVSHKTAFVLLMTLWVSLSAIVLALPSRETAYKMLMASYVTPNNIHMVGKEANEAIGVLLDNITNHMKELKNNK